MVKVAFWFDAPINYSGGVNYVSNLLYALSVVNSNDIEPFVFISTDVPDTILDRFSRLATVIRTPILRRKSIPWLVHRLLYRFLGSMAMVNAQLRKHQIDVLSHAWFPYLGKRQVKVITWIPDFQYLHLPEMFPKLNLAAENRTKCQMVTNSDLVVVSSEHAFNDLLSLFPKQKLPPVEVLHFVSQPFISPDIVLPDLAQLRIKYGFEEKFFLLPNQFWAHKNHEVVLRALVEAKQEGSRMVVLMTGNTKDYRLKGYTYIERLRDFIVQNEIESEARILGMIDYSDLLALMRDCVAFINPSRFEGWSSSVEEAKSFGKTILMSRIPVHLEQAPKYGAYFNCDDANELKKLMREVWDKHDSINHVARAESAISELGQRTRVFGQAYLDIINQVLGTG